ncbi:ribonuclease kappa-like isoform X2 [Topomyia yanbarensis]|nr:ribonuclease kappa-like isoform X2 [Topomyia yanbarensis]XP_058826676.1 ribonuclease kappa-like isoform X2 [Topomyia yanbarensis]XP_058826677.1 ribonuclease kappa-like isoform X2 [Topomyia yanbarensis]
MPICGLKLSLFGIIVSIWGIAQLFIMGLLYQERSVALIHDLPKAIHDKVYSRAEEFYAEFDRLFDDYTSQCWIAVCLYMVTLFFSCYQYYANSRLIVSSGN